MIIHTVSSGEGIWSIAAKYGIPVTKLIEDNDISDEHTAVGDELLILRPTKTKTVSGGDTLDSLSRRYGVRRSTLLANNPSLKGNERLRAGRIITIKQDAPVLGAATAMATVTRSSTAAQLTRIMPYATYIRINAASLTAEGRLNMDYNPQRLCEPCIHGKKVALLGVCDIGNGAFLESSENIGALLDNLTEAAKSNGFKGICLSARTAAAKQPERFSEFILAVRKRFIGCDLILFTDVFEDTPTEASELSDGAVLILPSIPKNDMYAKLSDFSAYAESSKVLVSLSAYADTPDKDSRISITEAKELCRRSGSMISLDKDSLICNFDYTRYKRGVGEKLNIRFPSLKYTKAKLEMISELGFMGISIEAEAVPSYVLSMFNALFARADYTLP